MSLVLVRQFSVRHPDYPFGQCIHNGYVTINFNGVLDSGSFEVSVVHIEQRYFARIRDLRYYRTAYFKLPGRLSGAKGVLFIKSDRARSNPNFALMGLN